MTSLPRKKNPSQVAQVETPWPINFFSDSSPSRRAEAPEATRARRGAIRDERAISTALVGLRERVEALYESSDPGPERDAAHNRLASETRAELASLPLRESDGAVLAESIRLNDACLALWGTYGTETERYVARLDALDGDLPAFIVQLREAADTPDPAEALLGPSLVPQSLTPATATPSS